MLFWGLKMHAYSFEKRVLTTVKPTCSIITIQSGQQKAGKTISANWLFNLR